MSGAWLRDALWIASAHTPHHISALKEPALVSADDLAHLADRASSLTSLDCQLARCSPVRFRFPPRLRSLTIDLPLIDSMVDESMIDSVAALPNMRRLHLVAEQSISHMSLDCLSRLQQLSELKLSHLFSSLDLVPAQMDPLRQLPNLTLVELSSWLSPTVVRHLVRPPMPMSVGRWKTISSHVLTVNSGFAESLSHLASLTRLSACHLFSIDALASWPQLTLLEIDLRECTSSTAAIIAGLQRCAQLTRLMILESATRTSR